MKTLVITFACGALCFTNCTTLDPYTGQRKTSNAALGAGVGAAGGAVLGAIIGNNTGDGNAKRGALIGAGFGGATGGGIGVYMDRQETKIRRQLQGTGVSVTRSGQSIILNMPHDITFESGRDQVRAAFAPTLDSVALVLSEFRKTGISVEGHTDSIGGNAYNQGLSERRASAVASYLNYKGVVSNRLNTIGYGESRPVGSNATTSGKAQNRRVELRIIPQEQLF